MEAMVAAFMLTALVCIYFIPAALAYHRRHKNRLSVLMLNIFLGWSGLGWIVALIWACTSSVEKEMVSET